MLIEPVIAAWKARHPSVSGHQGKYAMREIVNAILYQNRIGCQWEFLPHDMPPPGAVKYYFYISGAAMAPTRPSTTCCDGNCGRRNSD